jgi:hypothetical protein
MSEAQPMKTPITVRIAGFGEWQDVIMARLAAAALAEEYPPCINCEGSGNAPCSCGTCGHDHSAVCEICGGGGRLSARTIAALEQGLVCFDQGVMLALYERTVIDETKMLADFVGDEQVSILVRSGFHPYSELASRRLHLGKA